MLLADAVPLASSSTTGAIVVAALTSLAAVLVAVISTRKTRDTAPAPADDDTLAERVAVIEYRLNHEVLPRLEALEGEQ